MAIALANISYVLAIDFVKYFKNNSGKGAQENVLLYMSKTGESIMCSILTTQKYGSKASELSPVE